MKAATQTHGFFDKAPEHAAARATYLRIFLAGTVMAVLVIFAIFPIFWGALWKTPVYNLSGWIVVCLDISLYGTYHNLTRISTVV